MSCIKYELRCKTKARGWRLFDTYKDSSDPEIKRFADGLKSMKYTEGVKLIKVETIRTEIEI